MPDGEGDVGDKGPREPWAEVGWGAIFGVRRAGGNMESILQSVVGFLVWVVGNVVYVDKRRRGAHGFARFLAFWLGFPGTFLSKLLVIEGSQPALEPPPDDEEALLIEVRKARMERIEPPDGESAGETEERS